MMKPKVLVTREVFDETLDYLAQHCEIDSNQQDVPLTAAALAQRLADKDGLMCCLTDRIDSAHAERVCSRAQSGVQRWARAGGEGCSVERACEG